MESKENRIKRLALFCEENQFMDTSTIDEFYQLEIKRETNDIKGRYQLVLLIVSVCCIAGILASVFSQKDYCTPDNSKESKIVQNMQLNELKTTLILQNKEWRDSIQNYINESYPVRLIHSKSDIDKNWRIIDERGIVIQKGKVK